jgi:hypothetical protein
MRSCHYVSCFISLWNGCASSGKSRGESSQTWRSLMDTCVRVTYSSRPLILVIICFFTLSSARGQVLAVGDDTSTPIEGVGHNYIKMLSETVNPANGSVSLRIQASPAKARGITLPFAFSYDSNGVNHLVPGLVPKYNPTLQSFRRAAGPTHCHCYRWAIGVRPLQGA